MPISRMQMPRQLRRGGGIMNVVPRQGYFLGKVAKAVTGAVKGAAKGIGSILKSDVGKLALLTAGGFGLAGKGPLSFLGSGGGFGLPEFLTSGSKGMQALKVGAAGTLLGGVLGEMTPEEQAEVTSGRNIGALRIKLADAYKNQRTFADADDEDSAIAAQVQSDLSEYTSGAGGYANGGRIGYAFGDVVDQASGIMGLPQRVNQAGVKELDLRDSGGFIPPVGVKEKADDIPAMLSNNEFVFTADAVRNMGDGNVNKGAQRMYDMMKYLEKGGRV